MKISMNNIKDLIKNNQELHNILYKFVEYFAIECADLPSFEEFVTEALKTYTELLPSEIDALEEIILEVTEDNPHEDGEFDPLYPKDILK